MSLPPTVARTLYKSLQSSAAQLQHQLTRCGSLRLREVEALRRAAAAPLPKELRGLVDVRALTSSRVTNALDLREYVAVVARRVSEAASTPELGGVDAAVGFAALRHVNDRVDALRHLVYHTSSDAEAFGIRVEAASSYTGADRDRYFFRYRIRIDNRSTDTVQLLSRQWIIRDLDGRIHSVQGPGVIGNFPTLQPTQSFEYASAVPLATPLGTQSGNYIFVVDGADAKTVSVPVAPFSFRTPSMDSRLDNPNFTPRNSVQLQRKPKGRRGRRDDMRRR